MSSIKSKSVSYSEGTYKGWKSLKMYIILLYGVGIKEFTRQEMLNHFGIKFPSWYNHSIDIYRCNLKAGGYLETVKRGKYRVIRVPDKDLTVRGARIKVA